jgi:hypothetical protein
MRHEWGDLEEEILTATTSEYADVYKSAERIRAKINANSEYLRSCRKEY